MLYFSFTLLLSNVISYVLFIIYDIIIYIFVPSTWHNLIIPHYIVLVNHLFYLFVVLSKLYFTTQLTSISNIIYIQFAFILLSFPYLNFLFSRPYILHLTLYHHNFTHTLLQSPTEVNSSRYTVDIISIRPHITLNPYNILIRTCYSTIYYNKLQ